MKTLNDIKADRAALVRAYLDALTSVRDNELAALNAALDEDIAGGLLDATPSAIPSEFRSRGVLVPDGGTCYLDRLRWRVERDGWA